ncbi:MAG TPA: nucleotidyltransferase family protein [Acidobacteriaceae bacterium]|nr:nucleotidyltransferase family protein [Acidobacteriaceae bacterium]
MQPLLTLLRGESLDGISSAEWMPALDLADRENILPWTAACLSAAGPWSEQLTDRLREIRRNAQISAFLWNSTLKSTLADFHRRGILVIPLKGPWLAERLYGDAALRNYSDLDLLVRRSDISRAEGLLNQLGFLPASRRGDYERTWRRGSITIELHHDVENPLSFDFRIDEVWQRAQPAEFHGVPAWLLAPCDEQLFLCLHSARHRFERLSHILDVVFAFRSWPEMPAHALRTRDADHLLALGARMAARLDPRLAVPDPPSLQQRDRAVLDVLAGRLWQERLLAPVPRLDWRAKCQFFIALESRPWNRLLTRLRHLRILLTRLIDADFAFAARFHLHRTWQVWLLRPIRLLSKRASLRSFPADDARINRNPIAISTGNERT